MVMACFRSPARRKPNATSVTIPKNASAPPVKMYNPKMVEYHLGSIDISQSNDASVPTTTAKNKPGALQRDAIYIWRTDLVESCLADCPAIAKIHSDQIAKKM